MMVSIEPEEAAASHHGMHAASGKRENHTFQYLVTFSASLLLLSAGFVLGWSSPALPRIEAPDGPIKPTPSSGQKAWIVSLMECGVLLAAIPCMLLMDALGRRRTLLAGIVPLAISWTLIATATNVAALYVGRLLGGMTFGLCLSVVPVYLGEIVGVRIRGRTTVMVTVAVQLGVLLAYSLTTVTSTVAAQSWLSAVPLALFAAAAIAGWLPETPYWLMVHAGDADAARAILLRLYGVDGGSGYDEAWQRLCDEAKGADAIAMIRSTNGQCSGWQRALFGFVQRALSEFWHDVANRRAMIIIVGVSAIQVLCGSLTAIAYAEKLFADIDKGRTMSSSHVAIVFGAVQLVAATGSALCVDHAGRRPLLITSVCGTTCCNVFVVGYMCAERFGGALPGWPPVVAIMLGVVFYFVGLATVIFPLLAELLPMHLRRIGATVYTLLTGALIFIVNTLFQVVSDGWGVEMAFAGFALWGVVFGPLVWLFVPETKVRDVMAIRAELAAGWPGRGGGRTQAAEIAPAGADAQNGIFVFC